MNEWSFYLSALLLGVGLAMDAFSVSVANGLHEPKMKMGKMLTISGTFALFQFAMPMLGWVCVHFIWTIFNGFAYAIPWIALLLLAYIGGGMVVEFFFPEAEEEYQGLTFKILVVQGIATSIDALSVGFDIYAYEWYEGLLASGIIAVVTLLLCMGGCVIGKKFGQAFSRYATLLGGVILLGIGLEVYITNIIEQFPNILWVMIPVGIVAAGIVVGILWWLEHRKAHRS